MKKIKNILKYNLKINKKQNTRLSILFFLPMKDTRTISNLDLEGI
jgi:hypothetical protein